MSNSQNQSQNFNLTPEQGIEFIKEVISRVNSEYLNDSTMSSDNWKKFGEEMYKSSLSTNTQIFYQILNASNNKRNFSHSSSTLIKFLEKYFNDEICKGTETKFGVLSQEKIGSPQKNREAEHFDDPVAHEAVQSMNWILFTFGEKETRDFEVGGENDEKRRRYYIKQRPVKFSKDAYRKNRITIDNSDDPDQPNEKVNKYSGGCHFFTKKKGKQLLYYLETEAMDGVVENQRHLRLLLCFGALDKDTKIFSELALGTFSGIRDGGGLFAGIALLVRADVVAQNQEDFGKEKTDLSKIYFHESFISKPVQAAIRILLERKSKAFIKLPKTLDKFTMKELKTSLINLRESDRSKYISNEVMIFRTNAFISTPFFYDSTATALASNKQFLDYAATLIEKRLFPTEPKSIIHGLKTGSISTTDIAFESNFEHIRQSKFFVFILRDINFRKGKISTSFIELGFALGIRKKIIIFCSTKMREKLPIGVSKFDDDKRVLIIESPQDVSNIDVIETLLSDRNYSKKIESFLRNSYKIS